MLDTGLLKSRSLSLCSLVDDPYRSLPGLARKAGAYDKVDVPFTEFKWANYLPDNVPLALITNEKVAEAILQAVQLANTSGAGKLPGFRGHRSLDQLPTLDEIKKRITKRHGADAALTRI